MNKSLNDKNIKNMNILYKLFIIELLLFLKKVRFNK